MNIWNILGIFLCFYVTYADVIINPEEEVSVELKDENGELVLIATRESVSTRIGVLGTYLKDRNYTQWTTKTLAILNFGEVELKVAVQVTDLRWQITVRWYAPSTERLVDCIDLGTSNWFGGPEQWSQYWPVEKLSFSNYSYITKEVNSNAVSEPYWINSEGTILYVHKEVPLFIDQNYLRPNHLCFISEVKEPYSKSRTSSNLNYDIVFTFNAKAGHQYAVGRYLGKPTGYPDFRMIQHPIWSTWARYSSPINQNILMSFAQEIVDNGFKNSQLEIDDLWETCYGSMTVDTAKFPDFKQTIQDIKRLGFRVTMWIHPFINEPCDGWSEAKDKGYLVVTEDGRLNTNWWNSNGTTSSYVDFTNPEAASWWIKRLINLQNMYDIDGFKFDAGESSWSPQIPVQQGDINEHPSHITSEFVKAVSDFGPMIEIRTGQRTQHLPVFVRMIDKDSRWTLSNGLLTLITTLLQMNMNGYPLVLPDMIGGNGYGVKPSKELFVRWLQANTFMPTLQYSFVPWDFDEEAIEICRKYTDLHSSYAEDIRRAMRFAMNDGSPVNPPIWWVDPTDINALPISDQYLLGDFILVAPVLEQGATMRDIYLPKGVWNYAETDVTYVGPRWLYNFSAPLDTLPYFKLQ